MFKRLLGRKAPDGCDSTHHANLDHSRWVKVLFISLLFITFLFTPKATLAQVSTGGAWYDTSFQEWYTKVYDTSVSPPSEIFGERYTAAQVQWIIYALWANTLSQAADESILLCSMNNDANRCLEVLEGIIPENPTQTTYNEGEIQESLAQLIFKQRPLSGIGYLREKAGNLHITPEVKAQGFGFGALSPVRDLWAGVRDVTYVLFVLITIVFAFIIMFRVRLFSPQTVVSIQSALPRLVIALILVTFSYAIAGFMVDLVYVVIGLIAILLELGKVADSATTAYEFLIGEGTLLLWMGGLGIAGYLAAYAYWLAFSMLVSLFVMAPVAGFIFWPIYLAVAFLVLIILMVVMIIVFFKILWTLFKAVATVYLLVIAAPLLIGFGVLTPGGGFFSWLRNLAANLAVFPLTGVMIYLAFVFLKLSNRSAIATMGGGDLSQRFGDWVTSIYGITMPPPGTDISGWTPPLLGIGENATALIFAVVSLMALLLTPHIADIIKSLLAGRAFAYGTAIGALMAGTAVATYPAREPVRMYGEAYRKGFIEAMIGPVREHWQRVQGRT